MMAGSAGDFVQPKVVASEPEPAPAGTSANLEGSLLLDRYQILSRLGAGGMGVVYLAEHITIKKRCAIKVLADEYAGKSDIVDRFLQEARAASMIAHENVVEITDFGKTPSGSVFFVMEMLAGEDLAGTLEREGPLPWERVRGMMIQICRALGAAHDKGIIHRDMKPENCFRIERSGSKDFIKVLDFGIAKVTGDEADGKGLTRTGMIFGTPEYMSPEQAQGVRVDHRADIYAVGIILYELLTGRVPFTADTFMGVLTKHMFEVPPAPTSVAPGVKIPREAEAVILKALQKDRDLRFGSMKEMQAAIEAVGTGARAVDVVAEKIVRPPSGAITGFGGAEDEPSESLTAPRSSNLWLGVIVTVLLAAGGTALALGMMDDPPPEEDPPSPPPVVVETPVKAPEVEPPVPTEPKAPDVVKLRIATNVEASIVDEERDVILGQTNGDAITVARADEPRRLVLRADGYDDLAIEIVPSDDVERKDELRKSKRTSTKGGTKTTKTGEPKGGTGGTSGGGTQDPPKTSGGTGGDTGGSTITKGGSLGLKNPFENHDKKTP
ncbi:MAG: serine/threonine-protein kinase [Nannocystaceae bacterium]